MIVKRKIGVIEQFLQWQNTNKNVWTEYKILAYVKQRNINDTVVNHSHG